MKKIVSTFNVPYYGVDSYRAREVVAQLKRGEGVEAVRFFQATEGSPHYLLEIECGDEAEVVDSVAAWSKSITSQYSEYVADLTVRTFRLLAE